MKIVVTSGEPAGIGPDLCALLSDSPYASDLTVLGDAAVMRPAQQYTAATFRVCTLNTSKRQPQL
jgi:4-hydroxythreonine-4-phosphate dehydrogenase